MHQILRAHIKKREFNHGYLLCGAGDLCREMAFEAAVVILQGQSLEESKDCPWRKIEAHLDFLYQKFEMFGIDDSRALKEWASSRPFYGNGKVAVIEIFSLSAESANALLKLFEEPNEGVHFFVISPSAEIIVPTLRSRLTVIELGSPTSNLEVGLPSLKMAEKFLSSLPSGRLDLIKKTLTDKPRAVNCLNNLEIILEKAVKTQAWTKAIKAMEEVQRSREFIFDQASSFKIIMEHLALALPRL